VLTYHKRPFSQVSLLFFLTAAPRAAGLCAAVAFLMAISPTIGRGQDCSNLTPNGIDDWVNIGDLMEARQSV
jgi:hypothetical protein